MHATNEVLPALREQAALFARLEHFALRQRELVSFEDSRPLLALLADRQRLSLELTNVSERLRPVREAWPAFRDLLSMEERAEADRLLAASSESLRRVMEEDERDVRLLNAKRQMIAGALRNVDSTGGAMNAYAGQNRTSTLTLDEAL